MGRSPYMLRPVLGLALALWASMAIATEVAFDIQSTSDGLKKRLKAASLSRDTADQDDATAQDILAAARADYGRLVAALYDRGHYGGEISILVDGREAADISPLARLEKIDQIILRVTPGPVFRFSRASVTPLAPGTVLPKDFKPGEEARSDHIKDAARDGVEGWRNAGHAKTELLSQDITADHRNATLSADIRLSPGPRLRFGELIVLEDGAVRAERVRAIAGLPSGTVYSPQELRDASQRLRRTGAFSSVTLADAEEIRAFDTLDIEATLIGAEPRRFGAGAELSSLEGLSLSGFWLHRNLLGGGERLRVEGEISGIGGDSGGIDYSLGTRFERPATFTADTSLIVGARIQQLDEPDFRERSIRVGVGVSHIFSKTLEGATGLDFQYSDIDDALDSRQLSHLFLPTRLTHDSRDVPLNATDGAFIQLELSPFIGLNNSSAGARALLDARSYTRIGGSKRFVFATRAQIGSISGADVDEIPPGLLFFSGGAGTVRGQDFQSLGIPVGDDDQVGGLSFAAISAELRARVKGKWSVVGFADLAGIGDDDIFKGITENQAGVGVGVRYDTGLGPIRFDIATPLGDGAGQNIEFYIGIGQAF